MARSRPRVVDDEGSGAASMKTVKVKRESRRATTEHASIKKEKVQTNGKGKGKVRRDDDDDDDDDDENEDENSLDENGADEDDHDAKRDDVDMLDGDDGDENGDDDDDDDDGGASPKGRKRIRVDEDGEARPGPRAAPKARVKTLPRDDDGYIPGSIVRIQLENFVTYDWVEFRPGPYLNMILGPNGTGKSSIACAICLGLNWSPAILGRAADLNAFVKHGTEQGYIEIELKGPKGKPNLVIRRMIRAADRKSSFKLNGQTVKAKVITSKVAALNVQVGNLCSFLPQDKVSEFAQMNSCQLLRETQRAAGDERLTEWHDTLIAAGKELKVIQDILSGEREGLKTMQDRNAALERDVLRYKERRRIEHEIQLLEILLPVQIYREVRADYMNAKDRRNALAEKIVKLKEKNKPAHALKAQLERQHDEYKKAREAKKTAAQAKMKKASAKHALSEKLEEEAAVLSDQLTELKTKEKDKARRIRTLRKVIADTEEELKKPVQCEDMNAITAEGRVYRQENVQLNARMDDLRGRQAANADASGKEQAIINNCQDQLRSLDDVNVRKLQMLARWDKDCADTVEWLRKNQHRFKMEVFEPPVISLTVPDKRFVDHVEACFSANQIKCFVAQCQDDLDLLNHLVVDTPEALGRKGRINSWYRSKEQSLVPPPMTDEELKRLGFDGYAIEYVECPDGILWYLKRELQLHRTALALNGSRVPVDQAMQAVSRFTPTGAGGGANFIAGRTINMVSRSKYGKREAQNATRDVRPARNLVGTTVDTEAKRKLDESIREARMRREDIEREARELGEEETKLNSEAEVVKAKLEKIQKRKQVVTDAEKKLIRLQTKLDNAQEELQNKLDEPGVEEQRTKLKKDICDLSTKRVRIAKEYTQLIRETVRDLYESTIVGMQFIQVEANKNALEELCKEKDEKYNEAVLAWDEATKIFQAVKTRSKEALEASRKKIEEVDEALRLEYNGIEGKRLGYDSDLRMAQEAGRTPPSDEGVELRDAETLRGDLETQQHNLDLHLNTNPGVIEQYENRQQQIANLSETINGREKKCARLESSIKVAKSHWHPALQILVDSIGKKFSAAFDRIGCAGEIRIREDEDYDKWAIDILVKFRDDEKLQLLTAQRQSGGERALTTILYLMSLTEEARAPFSLVDEINQGMDVRAERNVHDSMVKVTCEAESAQYFLITPKLLPDLEYHERMKILCVNNGEWLPEDREVGNMMNMINSFVNHRSRSAAAA